MDIEKTVFTIITHSGEARDLFRQAIKSSREGNFILARQQLQLADDRLTAAHKKQSELIQLEAGGKKINPTILLIHGQDHLMSAMMMKEITEEIIDLYARLQEVSLEQ